MSSDIRELDGIPRLSFNLGWDNHLPFTKELLSYAATKNGHVVNTIKTMIDVPPPVHPGLGAPPDLLATHKDDKASFRDLCSKRIAVCSTLYRSLEPDIKSALDSDARATACMQQGLLGEVWAFLTQLIRGQGASNILGTLGEIGSFEMHDYVTWRQDIQRIQSLLEDVDTQYPEDADKVRLWNDIKVHRIITALDGIPEFKEFLTLHVIGNPILPTARDLVIAITQFANANRRLGRDFKAGEVQANAAASERSFTLGPCFNCKGPHLSMNCKEPKIVCRKCGRQGHLMEFCDQINKSSTYNRGSQDARSQDQRSSSNYKNYEQFRSTYTSKPSYKGPLTSTSTNNYQPSKRQSSDPKFKHQKARRSKETLIRLANSNQEEEPCLNRAYLSDLLDTDETYVDFYQDDLCAFLTIERPITP
jgi:hypothetical protein